MAAIKKITGDERNGLSIRTGEEKFSWYYLNGKKLFPVTVGNLHHGNVPKGTAHSFIRSLQLDNSRFADLMNCPMSGAEFHEHIKRLSDNRQL